MLPCSMQASWRTWMFPTLSLNFEVTVSTPTTPKHLELLEFPTWRGNSDSASSFQPMRLVIFIIKQLAFVPLLYQWSLQQNLKAIPMYWWNPQLISNLMPTTMNSDMSHWIWTWSLAQDQTQWTPYLALHYLFSALNPDSVLTTQVYSQLMFSSSQPLVMALISDFFDIFKEK